MSARYLVSPLAAARRSTGRLGSLVVAAATAFAAFSTLLPLETEANAPLRLPACGAAKRDGARLPAAMPISDPALPPPAIWARSAVIIDADSGRVLYDLGAHDLRAPASTTKMLTAILALEHAALDQVVISHIDASAMVGSSVMGLRPGVAISMRDLLFGLMLPSGNDAAVEIAKAMDGTVAGFVDRMNAKVAELGLTETHFENAHGLDAPGQYSSAYDLALIARYGMENPQFAELVGTRSYRLAPPSDYDLFNGNSLLDTYPGADGVKIGWTEDAGWTFVASATRDGHRLIVAVMDSEDRDADAAALLDWAWAAHHWVGLGPSVERKLMLAERFGLSLRARRVLMACS